MTEEMGRRDFLRVLGGAVAATTGLNDQANAQQQGPETSSEIRDKLAGQYNENGEITLEMRDQAEKIAIQDHYNFYQRSRGRMGPFPEAGDPIARWDTFIGKVKHAVHELQKKEPGIDPLLAVKRAIEENVLPDLKTYNRDASSIFDALLQNKMQCLSGTLAITLAARAVYAETVFANKGTSRLVLIYTDTHVQPGYIRTLPDGAKELVVIESTTTGDSSETFRMNDIKPQPPRVIVDADHDLMHAALGKRYNGKFDQSAEVKQVIGRPPGWRQTLNDAWDVPQIYRHSFGSGRVTVPSGDRPRPPASGTRFPFLRERRIIPQ